MLQLKLYHSKYIPVELREPFILSGYRPIGLSLTDCLKTIFNFRNNEVTNFWTHFLPCVVWTLWLINSDINFNNSFYLPLLCVWLGGIIYTFLSAFAHIFNIISIKFRHFCFFMDYSGIAIYEFGGIIAGYYIYRPLFISIFQYQYTYMSLATLSTVLTIPISCLSRFYLQRYQYLIRGFTFMIPYFWANIPLYVCFLAKDGSSDFLNTYFYIHIQVICYSFLTFFFFVSKIPERFNPGKFDIIFSSHNLAHVFSVITTTLHIYLIKLDTTNRINLLSQHPVRPTVYSTIGLFIVSVCIMDSIACIIFVLYCRNVIGVRKCK